MELSMLSEHLRFYLSCCVCDTPAVERRHQAEAAERMTPGWVAHSVKHQAGGLLVCWVCVQDARVLGADPTAVQIRPQLLREIVESRASVGETIARGVENMSPEGRENMLESLKMLRSLHLALNKNADAAEDKFMKTLEQKLQHPDIQLKGL